MILTCSSCATRFLVDAAAIGAAGRHVRCARCQHGWFQEPAADLPRSVDRMSPAPQAASDLEAMRADGMAPKQPAPLRAGANLPALPGKNGNMILGTGWSALGLVTVGLLAAGYYYREQIVTIWPKSAKLYEAIGADTAAHNLRFEHVRFSWTVQSDRPALLVEGVISNDGQGEVNVPPLLIRLDDGDGREIFRWTHYLPAPRLGAGARMNFETLQTDAPKDARNLQVTFLTGG
jgi:predicted Zn finger-like uncharacterized protein